MGEDSAGRLKLPRVEAQGKEVFVTLEGQGSLRVSVWRTDEAALSEARALRAQIDAVAQARDSLRTAELSLLTKIGPLGEGWPERG